MEVTLKQLLLEIENKWEIPSLNDEMDAVNSVADEFDIDTDDIIKNFPNGELRMLPNSIWEKLQNTDSTKSNSYYDIVQIIQKHQKKDPSYEKDWKNLKDGYSDDVKKMKSPIVVKKGKDYILISGNARLMVAKVMKISPLVYLFQV